MTQDKYFLNRNLSLLTDFYELTMANGYLENDMDERIAYFDMFYRSVPDDGGFAVAAGLDQLISYIQELSFTEQDIEYLRSKKIFSEKFLQYLLDFSFECDVWAIAEGTPVFPHEPIVSVRGPLLQAQLIETMVLITINHQSLIATKANRIVRAARGRDIIEFGSRRAQGYDGAIYGARAAYIGGCVGTSCTILDREFEIPALGTMAHSWVQAFPSELEAFKTYAKVYPHDCTLLVDTYDTLKSGIPNAIQTFDEVLKPLGARPKAIRLDSGDLAYLSIQSRKLLDEAGYSDCKIIASSSLDEYTIKDLLIQGAKIDIFGVGERLITAKSDPVFGGVYKLVAIEDDGEIIPKIKISDNINKITNPGFKQLWRFYDKENDKAIADLISLRGEEVDKTSEYELFDPHHIWKRKTISNYYVKPLLEPIFKKGDLVYPRYSIEEIRLYCQKHLDTLWDEVLRFEKPHKYYVDLSQKLWDVKNELLHQ
ncbi:MAG: nicotinate phosphoribosyltransferase [Clostridia bacterium]